MGKGGRRFRQRLEKSRPSLRDIFTRYRLFRYARPYLKYILLMLLFIAIYAACHGAQVGVCRELLRQDLWIPPQPLPVVSIDDVVNQLPEELEPGARELVRKDFAADFEGVLTEKERKLVPREKILAEAAALERIPPEDLIFVPAIIRLVEPIDKRDVSEALRKIYSRMSGKVLDVAATVKDSPLHAELSQVVGNAYAPSQRQPDMRRVRLLCLVLVGLAIIVGVSVLIRTLLRAWVLAMIARDVRNDLCRHIMSLDMGFFTAT